MPNFRIRDAAERLFWTFVAAFGGALVGPALFNIDLSALEAAAVAGTGATVNAVLLIARWRLSVLPDPGAAVAEAAAVGAYEHIEANG